MPPSFAAIVASLHGHVGKTLLARTLTDYFRLSGGTPYIFDTDPVERGLSGLFPEARVIDLAVVRDQMVLFDTLPKRSPDMRVVDVTHGSLTKFFELLRQTDVIAEARSNNVKLVIFYIPDRRIDSFEAGLILRDNFPDCAFIVVDNGFFREPRLKARLDLSYKTLTAHNWRFRMPELHEQVIDTLEDCNLSMSDFMRQPMSPTGEMAVQDSLTPGLRIPLRAWIFRMFQEIDRLTKALASRREPEPNMLLRPWESDLEVWEDA
jgi:hypothetical protein